MYKLKIVLIASLLFSTLAVKGQDSFKSIDSISYSLYQNREWKKLALFGNNSFEKGYDYYYLNVRTGVAYFERGNYKQAEDFFRRALENNSANTFAKEYLFWTLYNSGAEPEASIIYADLPDSIKSKMDYKPKRVFDYLYAEGGVKFSGNKSNANNLYYGDFTLNHQFSPRFQLTQSYIYMDQKLVWGSMQQHQYVLTPTINLNKRWKISTTLNYSNYQSQLDYNDTFNWKTSTKKGANGQLNMTDSLISRNYLFNGNYKQNSLLIQLNINKRIGNWSLTPHIGVYSQWDDPDYEKTVRGTYEITTYSPSKTPIIENKSDTVLTSHTSKNYFVSEQFGLDLSYTILNRLTLGLDANYIHYSGFNKFNVSPYFRLMITKKISVSAYYASKKGYLLSLNGGALFLNSYDVVKNKVSLTAEFILSKRIQMFTTYQYERDTDNLSLRNYQLNSAYIGLKIKL